MRPFSNLNLTALLDALAQFTSRYTKMIVERAPKEVSEACRETIQLLLTEIETRKKPRDPAAAEPDITLSLE